MNKAGRQEEIGSVLKMHISAGKENKMNENIQSVKLTETDRKVIINSLANAKEQARAEGAPPGEINTINGVILKVAGEYPERNEEYER